MADLVPEFNSASSSLEPAKEVTPPRAESPESDHFDVELEKDSQGLGITIAGKKSNDFDGGIYTHDIALRPIRSKFSTHFTTRM